MNRRGFLSSCLALAAAPAIVRADSLMRIVPRDVVIHTISEIPHGSIFTIEGFAEIYLANVLEVFHDRYAVSALEHFQKGSLFE